MDPRDFHRLASELAKGNSPAEIRTAISRTYYATFHVGAQILRGLGFRISTGSSGHGDVWKRLNNSGDLEVTKVGSKLGDLQGIRIDADYKLNDPNPEKPKTAQFWVQQAENMLRVLETCKNDPLKTQIISAIKKWESTIKSTA